MKRLVASLLALSALTLLPGCVSPPNDLDLALTRPTAARKYIVALQPPAPPAAINQLHAWHVQLRSPAGVPVPNARITVDGGMPQHGHGLPTRPQVTRALPDGGYLIEGMKFSMTGWWEIKLAIQAAEGADSVVFNTVVEAPGARR